MRLLRTPDDRFARLPGFPYAPRYAEVRAGDGGAIRMAYIDEGPRGAAPLLMLHGEPSWSFLYRKMIPPLLAAGHRVVAPDLVGFGRSDKPAEKADYSYARHVDWMKQLVIDRLDLSRITLVCQDWGGLIGLRLAAEHEARFDRISAANTFLPHGGSRMPEGFLRWREFSQTVPEFQVGRIVATGSATDLGDEVIAAYDAPFPDETYKAGARIFPMLVPAGADDPAVPANRAAWERLRAWTKPFQCCFSDSDPVTQGLDRLFKEAIPGAAGQPHATIAGAGHFLQEDAGEAWAAAILALLARG